MELLAMSPILPVALGGEDAGPSHRCSLRGRWPLEVPVPGGDAAEVVAAGKWPSVDTWEDGGEMKPGVQLKQNQGPFF